jgi:hypothetical protein
MAFDLTCFATRQARFEATRPAAASEAVASRVCTSSPPLTLRSSSASAVSPPPKSQAKRRRLFLPGSAASAASASGVYDGAMAHSRNVFAISDASSTSTGRLTATMPPNADTGSVSRARR